MRMTSYNGFRDFEVFESSTGARITNVMWVDDGTLEYGTLRSPIVIVNDEPEVDIHRVTAVRVNYAARRIEVNTPAAQAAPWPFPTSEPKACFECCQPETCKRIDVCVAHKCRFGEDDAP